MKEFIDKLIGRLEDEITALKNKCPTNVDFDKGIYKAEKIVNELAEEYSAITPHNSENSWIPCEKEFPNVGVTVLCYYKRCDRYNNIISYYYELMHRNEDYQWISNFGVCCGEVIKWMPLPPVYKEGSE